MNEARSLPWLSARRSMAARSSSGRRIVVGFVTAQAALTSTTVPEELGSGIGWPDSRISLR